MRTAITASLLLVCLFVSAQDNETGKVFVKSEPVGAVIFLGVKDENGTVVPKDTGKKTNALIEMPAGKQVIILSLAGYEDAVMNIVADPAAITKLEAVVMGRPTKPVDILFAEDGWMVSIDGKPVLDAKGKPATTPCTVKMSIGKHDVALTKDGFGIDWKSDIDAKTGSIEVKGKAEKEKTISLRTADKLVIWNTYNSSEHPDRGTLELKAVLYNNNQIVFESGIKKIEWTVNKDTSVTVDLPQIQFDRVRVHVTKYYKKGGGLAEIEIIKNNENIAKKWLPKASAAYNKDFDANTINDGITSSSKFATGYWLLPDNTFGWIELSFLHD